MNPNAREPMPSGFTTGKRLLGFLFCVLLGPALTGYFVALQGAIAGIGTDPWKDLLIAPYTGLVLALFAIPFGALPAIVSSAAGLWLYRRSPTIPLSAFLGMGICSLLVMVLVLRKPYETAFDTIRTLGLFLLPVLISAAICWRITRRWHSQPPPPNAPLQP